MSLTIDEILTDIYREGTIIPVDANWLQIQLKAYYKTTLENERLQKEVAKLKEQNATQKERIQTLLFKQASYSVLQLYTPEMKPLFDTKG